MAENPDDVLHVEGGKPLNGTIKVRGAKNFVSKAMVAALLAPGKSVLKNVPEIRDVHVVSDLLRLHGVDVDVDGANGIVTIDASRVQLADVADVDTLSGSSRIPILFSGPLVHRLGEAFIPALGGCAIGGRPIDFHLETLRKLGATVDKEHKDGIHITAPNGLHGAKIHLPYPSVGATEQTLLAAVLAEGKTELSGAATEPEIMDLVCVLQKMGAIISVDVDRTFRIEGVKELQGYTDVYKRQAENIHRVLVVPASSRVRLQAEKEGLDKVFKDFGAEWRNAGCSMCLGMNPDKLVPNERSISTSNRNFEGRQGKGSRTHLASPAVAAATAIRGTISSPADL